MRVRQLTWSEIDRLVDGLAARLPPGSLCWGVPRGGSVVAALLRSRHGVAITADASESTIAVDDLIDSGRTARMVKQKYGLDLEPLLIKDNTDWIVFPWEGTELAEDAENTVTRMLQQIGEDPNRPGLSDTPRQVVRCWEDLFSGYRYADGEVERLLEHDSTPAPPAPGGYSDGMLIYPGIPFISSCENHLLPFFGAVDAACLALEEEEKEGLGNVPRLVDALARRLQTPQRLAEQICHALAGKTGGAAVRLKGTYLCPMAQGLEPRQSIVESMAFSGGFRPDLDLQSRFLAHLP